MSSETISQELRGAPVAKAITEELAVQVEELRTEGVTPKLVIVRIGQKSDDLTYERAAYTRAEKVGFEVETIELPEDATQEQVNATFDQVSADASVHGCLPMRPFPAGIDEHEALQHLTPEKDVDCATDSMLLATLCGTLGALGPCTAEAVLARLDFYQVPLEGASIAVVGRSNVIGRPVAALLSARNATVTVCHSKTKDLAATLKQADVVVVAAGRAHLIDADYVRAGQTIIDVGINWDEAAQKLVGDVDTEQVAPLVSAYTPVPGGVGSVTTAILARHVVAAAQRTLA